MKNTVCEGECGGGEICVCRNRKCPNSHPHILHYVIGESYKGHIIYTWLLYSPSNQDETPIIQSIVSGFELFSLHQSSFIVCTSLTSTNYLHNLYYHCAAYIQQMLLSYLQCLFSVFYFIIYFKILFSLFKLLQVGILLTVPLT